MLFGPICWPLILGKKFLFLQPFFHHSSNITMKRFLTRQMTQDGNQQEYKAEDVKMEMSVRQSSFMSKFSGFPELNFLVFSVKFKNFLISKTFKWIYYRNACICQDVTTSKKLETERRKGRKRKKRLTMRYQGRWRDEWTSKCSDGRGRDWQTDG